MELDLDRGGEQTLFNAPCGHEPGGVVATSDLAIREDEGRVFMTTIPTEARFDITPCTGEGATCVVGMVYSRTHPNDKDAP